MVIKMSKQISDPERLRKEAQIEAAIRDKVLTTVNVGTITMKTIPSYIMDDVLSAENLKDLYFRAFTHDSYDYDNSYELLETLGDLMINTIVSNRIIEAHPDLNQKELSNMLAYYKSNKVFGDLIVAAFGEYRLKDLIFMSKDVNEDKYQKIYADVFEALIYAVYVSTNKVLPGIGYACAENVYKLMSRGAIPDEIHKTGNPKSVITEIFTKEEIDESPKKKELFERIFTIRISREAVNTVNNVMTSYLRLEQPSDATGYINIPKNVTESYRPKFDSGSPTAIIISAEGLNKQTARTNAYNKLIDYLNSSFSLTPKTYHEKKRINIIEGYSRKQEIYDKQLRLNETIYFEKKKSEIDGMLDWKLIVRGQDQKRKLIASETVDQGSGSFDRAKTQLMNTYLDNDPRDKQ
jgi:dsRNA-specific ribonuclease